MTNYIDNATFRKQKSALTRAINSGDPLKVARAVQKTVKEWEDGDFAWPDDWHRWNIAYGDAVFAVRREGNAELPNVVDIRSLAYLPAI